jgi:hypothetical protein
MTKDADNNEPTLALNTMLERDFVSPLTSIRGVLEIIRDFPDLSQQELDRFIGNAMSDCARLEAGIDQLASAVYAAVGDRHRNRQPAAAAQTESEFADRVHIFDDLQVIEVDFSDFVLSNSAIVNAFYDYLEQRIEATENRWYILVNYRHCSVWPEAWVAFAHRGQKVNKEYSLGTVRYVEADEPGEDPNLLADPYLFASRAEALARIDELRRAAAS